MTILKGESTMDVIL